MRFGDSISMTVSSQPFTVTASSLVTRMDESSFQALYQETAPKLWSYVRRSSGDAALADDIVQEAFLRFLRAGLPPMDALQRKSYLYRTASTLLVDYWRRQKRERHWSLRNFFAAKPQQETMPGDAMDHFRELKPQEQNLLWLAYVEGFDHREIATALKISEKSVRVLLFRARKRLGDTLSREGFGHRGEL